MQTTTARNLARITRSPASPLDALLDALRGDLQLIVHGGRSSWSYPGVARIGWEAQQTLAALADRPAIAGELATDLVCMARVLVIITKSKRAASIEARAKALQEHVQRSSAVKAVA